MRCFLLLLLLCEDGLPCPIPSVLSCTYSVSPPRLTLQRPLVLLACSCSTSPPIHLAKLMGLVPGTTYYYTVGDGTNMSPEYSFTTLATALPAAGAAILDTTLLYDACGSISLSTGTRLGNSTRLLPPA